MSLIPFVLFLFSLGQNSVGILSISIMLLGYMRKTTFTLLLILFTLGAPAFAQDAAPAPNTNNNLYLGVMGGVAVSNSGVAGPTTSHPSQLNYGARIGIEAFQIANFSKVAFGVSYDDYAISMYQSKDSLGYASVMAQVNFREVAGSGFYFGPEVGMSILSVDTAMTGILSYGAFAGYEIKLCDHLAIGPEVHYDYFGSGVLESTQIFSTKAWKFLGAVTYSFH